jgi:CspA family cold shock protein
MTRQLTLSQMGNSLAAGTVEFYNKEEGLGFIQADGGGKGAFVHVSALARGAMPDANETLCPI